MPSNASNKLTWVQRFPPQIGIGFCPGVNHKSIVEAVRWFRQQYDQLPRMVEAEQANLHVVQRSVRMWSPEIPDPLLQYYIEKSGEVVGRQTYNDVRKQWRSNASASKRRSNRK